MDLYLKKRTVEIGFYKEKANQMAEARVKQNRRKN